MSEFCRQVPRMLLRATGEAQTISRENTPRHKKRECQLHPKEKRARAHTRKHTHTFLIQAAHNVESVERKAPTVVEVGAQHTTHGPSPHGSSLLHLVVSYQVLVDRDMARQHTGKRSARAFAGRKKRPQVLHQQPQRCVERVFSREKRLLICHPSAANTAQRASRKGTETKRIPGVVEAYGSKPIPQHSINGRNDDNKTSNGHHARPSKALEWRPFLLL